MNDVLQQITDALGGGETNVGETERALSVAGGGALLGAGLKKGGAGGLLLLLAGGALVQRGLTGHCAIYDALGKSTAGPSERERADARVEEADLESFPASDPPSFTPPGALGAPAHTPRQ